MSEIRARRTKRHPWSTCLSELPHRSLDDVRRTVFLMPSMHVIIPLSGTATDTEASSADEPGESIVSVYQWADSESGADPKRWRNTGSNPPLMRTRFISPEPDIRPRAHG